MGHVTPLGVQQYICCYFTLELDNVSQQSLMSNMFRILHTTGLCVFHVILCVSLQKIPCHFVPLLVPNSGDATDS